MRTYFAVLKELVSVDWLGAEELSITHFIGYIVNNFFEC
jgi:hypothetical protein